MKTRRDFLQAASLAATAAYLGNPGSAQFAFAQSTGGRTKRFIKAFMRGGADGLHLLPPDDPLYRGYRPDIHIAPGTDSEAMLALDMTGQNGENPMSRGMNPNLWPLMDIWSDGRLLLCPATHFDGNNRSHFDCQRWIGTGAPNNLIDGYLNRYMQVNNGPEHPIRGATLGQSRKSREMVGDVSAPSINRQGDFNIQNGDFCSGSGCSENRLLEQMTENASHPTDLNAAESSLKESQLLMIETIEQVQGIMTPSLPQAALDLAPDFSGQGAGRGLKLIWQLVEGGIPLEVAAINVDGNWDSHSGQISTNESAPITDQEKSYNRRMHEGARDLAMFYHAMGGNNPGSHMEDTIVMVCTEFGRTVKQNGSIGTDHGHAGSWYVFGGGVRGGFAPDVATLEESTLDRNNYLPRVVNYKDVVGEIMVKHLGLDETLVSDVFPGHTFNDLELIEPVSG